MKDLKSKNIFSSFLYERKNLSISYIIKKFGSRIIDVLITFPLSIIKENLIKKLELKYIDSLVTLDIKVVDYIKNTIGDHHLLLFVRICINREFIFFILIYMRIK